MSKVKFGTVEIIASFLGVLIFVLLEWLEKLGIFSGAISNELYNWVQFRIVILTLVAAVFGPIAGAFCGFAGSMLINVMFEYTISLPEVIVVGLFGIAIGSFSNHFRVRSGGFTTREFMDFCAVSVAASLFAGVMLLPVLLFVMDDKFLNTTIIVGCKSVLGNSILSIIVCGILMSLISNLCGKIRKKKREEQARYMI